MRRITITFALAITAMLLVSGSICAKLRSSADPSPSSQVIADMAQGERGLIRQIDVADCRTKVLAGQEKALYASDTRAGRSELARRPGLVATFCECKFEATSGFLTKRDVVSHWLSADFAASGPGSKELDGVVRDCTEQTGLRTLQVIGMR